MRLTRGERLPRAVHVREEFDVLADPDQVHRHERELAADRDGLRADAADPAQRHFRIELGRAAPSGRGELRRHVARRAARERYGGVGGARVEQERERLAADGDGREVRIERAAGERNREQGPAGGARARPRAGAAGSLAAARRAALARPRVAAAGDEQRDGADMQRSSPHEAPEPTPFLGTRAPERTTRSRSADRTRRDPTHDNVQGVPA